MSPRRRVATAATPALDCYSDRERGLMDLGRRLREVPTAPLLRLLTRLGLHPDHLTALSLFAGLAFVPLWVIDRPAIAVLALLTHVLLDGLDGPLARHQGTASPRGSFTDTMADLLVVATTLLTVVATRHAGPFAGGLHVFLYTAVIFLAVFRNALSVPYSWLVRPRFAVYGWIAVEAIWTPGWLNGLLWTANTLLGAALVAGFVAVRRRFDRRFTRARERRERR